MIAYAPSSVLVRPGPAGCGVSVVGLAPGFAVAQEEDGQPQRRRLRLDPCEDLDGAWCGSLRRR
jgi:hypothetical protein